MRNGTLKRLAMLGAAAVAWLALSASALAAAPAGPPFPDRVAGRAVYDDAGIFSADTVSWAEQSIAALRSRTGLDIVVYTQVKPESASGSAPDDDAKALLTQWNLGGAGGDGLAILYNVDPDRPRAAVSLQAGPGLLSQISDTDLLRIRWSDMESLLAQGRIDESLTTALTRITTLTAPPAGPPYPNGQDGHYVYDYAGLFKPATVKSAEQTIAAIRARTGAVVVVYTQVKPDSDDLDKANADARALMDQWHVGRKGFDDGLVIMFDMQPNLCHGQVSLYAGAGYRAAFLSDSERQNVFDNSMLPYLRSCDIDDGVMAALRAVDENATPDHAAQLEFGRRMNALLVVGALLLGLVLILIPLGAWLRHGRDPIYIDDHSILMPAPPEGLSPAMATLLLDDRTSKRTVSAALIDLAAHGAIAFRQKLMGSGDDADIGFKGEGDGKIGVPESRLLSTIESKAGSKGDFIDHWDLYRLIKGFDKLKSDLEKDAVHRGWLVESPSAAIGTWGTIAGIEFAVAVVAFFVWLPLQISLLFVLTFCLLVAFVATIILAHYMPARTKEGAVLNAQLLAYKRSLGYSMAQSGSVAEVVQRHAVPWVTTPDQAMVWAVAFGLNRELDGLLSRAVAGGPGSEDGATHALWAPTWWTYSGSSHAGGSGGSGAGFRSGLLSSTGFPDPGGIVAALGSISSPSSPPSSSSGGSSSWSSGGSSFGGGGGGGGGGAGGGF